MTAAFAHLRRPLAALVTVAFAHLWPLAALVTVAFAHLRRPLAALAVAFAHLRPLAATFAHLRRLAQLATVAFAHRRLRGVRRAPRCLAKFCGACCAKRYLA